MRRQPQRHKVKAANRYLADFLCVSVLLSPRFLDFYEDFSLRPLPSLQRTLCSEFVELIEPDAVRCKNSGNDVRSAGRDDVTVGAWNLLNEVVRPKHSQQA